MVNPFKNLSCNLNLSNVLQQTIHAVKEKLAVSPELVPVAFLNTVIVPGAREDEGEELFAKAHNRQFYNPICIPGMEHLNHGHQQLRYALQPTTIFKLWIENPVASLLAVSRH